MGHTLRNGNFPAPTNVFEKDVVIIGGGISGLAAAYRLHQSGQKNFVLLDLEKQTGGNASSGKNDVSAYPWGAHYVPLLTEESVAVKRLFEEIGVITGYDAAGRPRYNEYYICADPHERLYMYGRWQDGLVPRIGVTPDEEAQYTRFFDFVDHLKNRRGRDGKRLFAIPLDQSSQDQEWIALDALTMSEWMDQHGYHSPHLRWYVDYSCRDDFGTRFTETSAWAGLHYFASRNGVAANTDSSNVITWPEGNGWLANKLAEPCKDNILTSALAYRVTEQDNHVTVEYWDQNTQTSTCVTARAAILATPHFVTSRMVNSTTRSFSSQNEAYSYSPWAVVNITLSKMPAGQGAPLSWDNVVYDSPLLGYVVATHQVPQLTPRSTVVTYYWPLTQLSPAEARREALNRRYEEWQRIILKELLHIHPELEGAVERLDVWVWGHAMVRPTPGFIWGDVRQSALKQHPPLFTAHTDMSGISIFEEAYTHGVRAAEGVLSYLGLAYRSVL